MSFFEQVHTDRDQTPLVLIDNSGSTGSRMGKENVLNRELLVAQRTLQREGINQAYLMFWNSRVSFPFGENAVEVEKMLECDARPTGGTDIYVALHDIPETWVTGKQTVDIRIFTDGEVRSNDEQIKKEFRKFINRNAKIFITTVEPNNRDYITANCNAGNSIYRILNKNCLMKHVRSFESYNQFHKEESFISLDNPDVPPGFVPFRGQCFRMDRTPEFLKHLSGLIQEINDKFLQIEQQAVVPLVQPEAKAAKESESDSETDTDYSESEDEDEDEDVPVPANQNTEEYKKLTNELLKLAHDTSLSVYHLMSGKAACIQRGIINMFSRLFSDTPLYKEIREILMDETENHNHGKSTTFQAYRNNREKVFERAQMDLYENVRGNTVNGFNSHFVSFPVHNSSGTKTVIRSLNTDVEHSICILDKEYKKGAFKLGKHTVPMFPENLVMDHKNIDQCVRQWARANYSRKYGLNAAADILLYYVLTDALAINISDTVSDTVKKSYRGLARLLLDRKRFGTHTTEWDYLMDNNPPAPVTGKANMITYLLTRCVNFSTPASDQDSEETKEPDIHPFTLWYGIVKMMGNTNLLNAQRKFCEEDMGKDGVTEETVMEFLKNKLTAVSEYNASSKQNSYDYTCFITLDDTSETGGYAIPAHSITDKIHCAPQFVMSDLVREEFMTVGTLSCPYCHSTIQAADLFKVKTEAENLAEEAKLSGEDNQPPTLDETKERFYDSTKHVSVDIPENIYKQENVDNTLHDMDSCDFETISYAINAPTIKEPLGTRFMEIQTQEEFTKNVNTRYPFLQKINFKENQACLAGGFCRSILLKQKLKDLDIFFHGENRFQHFRTILKQFLDTLRELKPGCKFLMMYKPMFNVFEVVCVTDPTNFLKSNYILDNFKQYDFKSLHRFDKKIIIDPETGKVYKKKNMWDRMQSVINPDKYIENPDFSNYFEDGDVNGIHMAYRLQFILAEFGTMNDIMESFDMNPCRVCYDGETTRFTADAVLAYKYMINVVNEKKYSTLFNHRLSKYFTYGFSIVAPELNLEMVKNSYRLSLDRKELSFDISGVDGNTVMVKHNSNIKDKLESLEALEKKNADKGKSLYKSSLFCSFVSLLRYVKINDINYLFTDDSKVPDENGGMKFRESEVNVHFIEKIDSRIDNNDWYKSYRRS